MRSSSYTVRNSHGCSSEHWITTVHHRLHCSTSYAVTVWLIHRCSILIWPGPHRTYCAILDCIILSCTVLFLIRSLTSISSHIFWNIWMTHLWNIFIWKQSHPLSIFLFSRFPVFRTLFFPLTHDLFLSSFLTPFHHSSLCLLPILFPYSLLPLHGSPSTLTLSWWLTI